MRGAATCTRGRVDWQGEDNNGSVGQLPAENLALIINRCITATWTIPKPPSPSHVPGWDVPGGLREAALMPPLFSRATLGIWLLSSTSPLPRDCAQRGRCGHHAWHSGGWAAAGLPHPGQLRRPLFVNMFQSLGSKCEKCSSPPTAPTVETTGTDRHIYKVCKATKPKGYRTTLAKD